MRWAKSKSRTPALTLSLVVPRTKTRAHRMSSGSPGGFPIGLDVEAGSGGGRRRRRSRQCSCLLLHSPSATWQTSSSAATGCSFRQSRLRMLWWGLFINGVYNNGVCYHAICLQIPPPRASAAYVLLFDDSPALAAQLLSPLLLGAVSYVLVSFLSHALPLRLQLPQCVLVMAVWLDSSNRLCRLAAYVLVSVKPIFPPFY